jgi:RecA/RadA recombinase
MRNFLKMPNARGVYLKAEGRLGPEMRARSGVKFVYDPKEWEDGTCLVFECNIFEIVVDLMRNLVAAKECGKIYNFLLDSVDGLIPQADLDRPFSECNKIAGGAVISSTLMKKIGIALPKRGHMALFISQVRADIKLDPYSKAPVRQTTATGGNALLHYANWILEFEPKFKGDLILENEDAKYDAEKNKIVGHFAKITIKKSPNESTNNVIKYPICHGRKGGTSIWVEREISKMLMKWELLTKKGGWYTFDEDLVALVADAGVEMPNRLQGYGKVNDLILGDEKLKDFLLDYLQRILEEATNAIPDTKGLEEEN